MPIIDNKIINTASDLQRGAANPQSSIFVSANAGTGKTQVLIMRVLRLLLAGAPPDTILCVTYTKAAAAEMRSRLNKRLSKWAICSERSLLDELKEIGETQPTQDQIATARRLFAEILDKDDGPLIETVHSFCQSILLRFPIEAGITPYFEIISENQAEQMILACFHRLLAESASFPETGLAHSMRILTAQTDENQICVHLKTVLKQRSFIDNLATNPQARTAFTMHLRTEAGLFDPEQLDALEKKTLNDLARCKLDELAKMLTVGGTQQQKRAQNLIDWLNLPSAQKQAKLNILALVFFTEKYELRARLADKAITKHYPECEALQQDAINILGKWQDCRSSAACFRLTNALIDVACQFYVNFQNDKAAKGGLDYDDLILFTGRLLARDQMIAWVHWKLDQGINHLLIDEAQDTSPEQWALLKCLSAPFFDDEPDSPPRTIFAVGDYKQSIYSFQGARPDIFIDSRDRFEARAHETKKPFSLTSFSLSFRSSLAILKFVDTVMSKIIDKDPQTGLAGTYHHHDVLHKDIAG